MSVEAIAMECCANGDLYTWPVRPDTEYRRQIIIIIMNNFTRVTLYNADVTPDIISGAVKMLCEDTHTR